MPTAIFFYIFRFKRSSALLTTDLWTLCQVLLTSELCVIYYWPLNSASLLTSVLSPLDLVHCPADPCPSPCWPQYTALQTANLYLCPTDPLYTGKNSCCPAVCVREDPKIQQPLYTVSLKVAIDGSKFYAGPNEFRFMYGWLLSTEVDHLINFCHIGMFEIFCQSVTGVNGCSHWSMYFDRVGVPLSEYNVLAGWIPLSSSFV